MSMAKKKKVIVKLKCYSFLMIKFKEDIIKFNNYVYVLYLIYNI